MNLRTKLIAAFLLLSVVPLGAVVVGSHVASARALRQAVWMENQALAGDMSERMGKVRQGIDRKLQGLKALPLDRLVSREGTPEARSETLSALREAVGDVAPLVEALEFIPHAPAAPPPPPPGTPPGEHAPPAWSRTVIRISQLAVPVAAMAVREDTSNELSADQRERLAKMIEEIGRLALDHAEAKVAAGELAAARAELAGALPAPPAPPPPLPLGVVTEHDDLSREERAAIAEQEAESQRLLGRSFECQVTKNGEAIGELRAKVSAKELLRAVLGQTRRDRGEVPFAVDEEGQLYTARPEDLDLLRDLSVADRDAEARLPDDWTMVKVKDGESGVTYGIARPVKDSLLELKRTAGRNLALGLGVIGLAVIGILPLSRRITRDLATLNDSARALAAGDLDARANVRSRDEVGALASTFNQMAADLKAHQREILERARIAKESEIERRLLAADNERKGAELEEARSFQLSLLPKEIPQTSTLEIAVFMKTATEVGGDYYDFHLGADGTLTVALGDATGHGARAGTMVTALKSLFVADAGRSALPHFLGEASRAIRQMDLGRMAMALMLVRFRGAQMTVASAGMPPPLVFRAANGRVEELTLTGLPLGAMAEGSYPELTTDLAAGDTILLHSDGFPELLSAEGDPLGYARAAELFGATASLPPREIIAELAAGVRAWKDDAPPDDDVTFLAIRAR